MGYHRKDDLAKWEAELDGAVQALKAALIGRETTQAELASESVDPALHRYVDKESVRVSAEHVKAIAGSLTRRIR